MDVILAETKKEHKTELKKMTLEQKRELYKKLISEYESSKSLLRSDLAKNRPALMAHLEEFAGDVQGLKKELCRSLSHLGEPDPAFNYLDIDGMESELDCADCTKKIDESVTSGTYCSLMLTEKDIDYITKNNRINQGAVSFDLIGDEWRNRFNAALKDKNSPLFDALHFDRELKSWKVEFNVKKPLYFTPAKVYHKLVHQ